MNQYQIMIHWVLVRLGKYFTSLVSRQANYKDIERKLLDVSADELEVTLEVLKQMTIKVEKALAKQQTIEENKA